MEFLGHKFWTMWCFVPLLARYPQESFGENSLDMLSFQQISIFSLALKNGVLWEEIADFVEMEPPIVLNTGDW